MPWTPGILPICCHRFPHSEPPARGGTDTHRGNRLHAGREQGWAGGNSSGTADGTIWAWREQRPLGIPPTRFIWTGERKLGIAKPNWDIQVAAAQRPGCGALLTVLRLSVMGACPWRCAGSRPCHETGPSVALTPSVHSSSPRLQAYVGLRRLGISPKLAESRYQDKSICDQTASESQLPPPSHQQNQLEI